MPEIKLSKRYKCAGDIMPKLLEIGFDFETASDFLNSIADADVVPKSEVESYKQIAENQRKLSMDRFFEVKRLKEDIERLVQENETLKDNDEHLAVMLEEKEIELKAMRGAANSLKVHYENAKTELASEIFAEIEREIEEALKSNYKVLPHLEFSNELYNSIRGKIDALRGIDGFIAELKKKYTEDTK